MKLYCDIYKIDKKVFVCDSFAGLPRPSGKFQQDHGDTHYAEPKLAISLEEVRNNFNTFKCLDEKVIFIKGFFGETLPNNELVDKLSILRVKQIKITNPEKLSYVNKEFELLYNFSSVYFNNEEISKLYYELVETNSKLWEIEDELRILETKKSFDEKFIELARAVYYTNDKRFILKNEINERTSSEIREVKEYVEY